MKLLITGSDSYLALNLIHWLVSNKTCVERIYAVDRTHSLPPNPKVIPVRYAFGNASNTMQDALADADFVIHAAGEDRLLYCTRFRESAVQSNILAAEELGRQLLSVNHHHPVPVMYLNTSMVFDPDVKYDSRGVVIRKAIESPNQLSTRFYNDLGATKAYASEILLDRLNKTQQRYTYPYIELFLGSVYGTTCTDFEALLTGNLREQMLMFNRLFGSNNLFLTYLHHLEFNDQYYLARYADTDAHPWELDVTHISDYVDIDQVCMTINTIISHWSQEQIPFYTRQYFVGTGRATSAWEFVREIDLATTWHFDPIEDRCMYHPAATSLRHPCLFFDRNRIGGYFTADHKFTHVSNLYDVKYYGASFPLHTSLKTQIERYTKGKPQRPNSV